MLCWTTRTWWMWWHKVKLFGGGVDGVGGVANAIVQIAEGGRGVTGSVIGVDLVNGGGGYTFPPFVEIVDECGQRLWCYSKSNH